MSDELPSGHAFSLLFDVVKERPKIKVRVWGRKLSARRRFGEAKIFVRTKKMRYPEWGISFFRYERIRRDLRDELTVKQGVDNVL